MKGMQKMASLLMGMSALALAAAPGMTATTATAATLPAYQVDPAIVRAAMTPVTGGTAGAQNSGGVVPVVPGVVLISDCIVKFFQPEELKVEMRKAKEEEEEQQEDNHHKKV